MAQDLEWSDISYFSKGQIATIETDGKTTVVIDRSVRPSEFLRQMLIAARKAEFTLNAIKPLTEQSNRISEPVFSTPVLNPATNTYSTLGSVTVTLDFPVEKSTIENN